MTIAITILSTFTFMLFVVVVLTMIHLSNTNKRMDRLRADHDRLAKQFFDYVTEDVTLDEY